jgi:hypothetical protein
MHRVGKWRLVSEDRGHVLIPPDVTRADEVRRTFTAGLAHGSGTCAATESVAIEMRRSRARVTVTRDALAAEPQGWLASWAASIEREQCLAPGEGEKLAVRVADSVPLDPAVAFRLLYPDERRAYGVDISPGMRLQVLSPLWRKEGVGMVEGPMTVTAAPGNDYQLTLTAKATDNLLGYEKTFYAVRPKPAQPGSVIVPVSTDRHVNANNSTEHRDQPSTNYFQFPPDAAYYRLFYESWRNDFSALVIAAHTPAELEQQSQKLGSSGDSASCEQLNTRMCIQIPKDVAVNPFIVATVNGLDTVFMRGARVRQIIAGAHEDPQAVLPRLVVEKPWNGRMIRVVFDPVDAAILDLPLFGGESISWR